MADKVVEVGLSDDTKEVMEKIKKVFGLGDISNDDVNKLISVGFGMASCMSWVVSEEGDCITSTEEELIEKINAEFIKAVDDGKINITNEERDVIWEFFSKSGSGILSS